ncbi:MAG: hypothetical protein CVU88_02875 [Firmicutes bacterium HGW-Firmicutes-13]|nr:MAG: hypothetical protein CVU88_02875 [Firmicutes bacterium HGW-Firmicutes-13]
MKKSFRYRVKDKSGKNYQGTGTASSREQFIAELWEQDYLILEIKEYHSSGKMILTAAEKLYLSLKKKAGPRDLMVFCRQFATMLSAGITVLHSLRLISQKAENCLIGKAVDKIVLSLEQGKILSSSFAEHPRVFPGVFIHMIEAGEAGGFLEEVLYKLADHFEKEHDLKEKVKTAAAYPLIILVVSFFVTGFLIIKVLPTFTIIYSGMGVELPPLTGLLIGLGEMVKKYALTILIYMIISILVMLRYIKSSSGRARLDKLLFLIPVYGNLSRKIMTARFARMLGLLIGSGVGLLKSLELVENISGNILLSRALRHTREIVLQGHSITEPLAQSSLFPSMVVEMIQVGEDTGSLDNILLKTALYLENEIEYMVERLTAIVEPLLIVILAFVVGTIALSVLTPMFDLFQHIG